MTWKWKKSVQNWSSKSEPIEPKKTHPDQTLLGRQTIRLTQNGIHVLKLKRLLHFATLVQKFDVWPNQTIFKGGFGKEKSLSIDHARTVKGIHVDTLFVIRGGFAQHILYFAWKNPLFLRQLYEMAVRSILSVKRTMRFPKTKAYHEKRCGTWFWVIQLLVNHSWRPADVNQARTCELSWHTLFHDQVVTFFTCMTTPGSSPVIGWLVHLTDIPKFRLTQLTSARGSGEINHTDSCSDSPEPPTDVYWFRLNFNISNSIWYIRQIIPQTPSTLLPHYRKLNCFCGLAS